MTAIDEFGDVHVKIITTACSKWEKFHLDSSSEEEDSGDDNDDTVTVDNSG